MASKWRALGRGGGFLWNLRLACRPCLWRPDVVAPSIAELELVLPLRIRGVIFDLDQTILSPAETRVPDGVIRALVRLNDRYRCCILSNCGNSRIKRARLIEVSGQTGIPHWLPSSRKPAPEAFLGALTLLGTSVSCTAMVGDRILTDVVGANNVGMLTVKVDPIEPSADPLIAVQLVRRLETWATSVSGRNHRAARGGL